jgi:hypothetical protein
MDIRSWEVEIKNSLKRHNLNYRPTYSSIALVSPRPPEAKDLGANIMIAMEREFWRRVCAREVFGDTKRIEDEFGRSLEDNYSVKSGPFLDVAKTYWTIFKRESNAERMVRLKKRLSWDGSRLFVGRIEPSNE